MPTNKTPTDIPEQNVLNLRQIMAERQAATEARTRRSWRWPARRPSTRRPRLHQPTGTPVAWPLVKRETLKFSLVLLAVLLVGGGIFSLVRLTQTAKAVTVTAKNGFIDLRTGADDLGHFAVPDARRSFDQAVETFTKAEQQLHRLAAVRGLPIINRKYQTAERIISVGQHLARAGQTFSRIMPLDQPPLPAVTVSSKGIITGSIGVLQPLLSDNQAFQSGLNELVAAIAATDEIDPAAVPTAEREWLRLWRRLSPALFGSPSRINDFRDVFLALLAPAEPREYLVIFQNNDELRATGGFAGTFLLVKFDRGTFTVLDAPGTGPFDLASQTPHTSLPPQPILAVAPYWTFHDANWFLDVPTSATFMLDFYQQARGFRPDGIIYVTPGLVEDLLAITGPIRPAGYGVDITAANFVRATEQQVEFGYDKALNNPKQFLIDLVPSLLTNVATLQGLDGWRAAAAVLQRATISDLLLYSQDAATEAAVERLGWDGRIARPTGDYLAVVETNLGGGKTDRAMTVDVAATVTASNQQLIHRVAVTRRHGGQTGDPLTGATQRTFVRVYAPANAEFIDISGASAPPVGMFLQPDSAATLDPKLEAAEGRVLLDARQGVRLSRESGQSVFGAWSIIEPGQSQVLTFTYATPLGATDKPSGWSLRWQKQPGAPLRRWRLTFEAGAESKILSALPTAGAKLSKHSVSFTTDSTTSRTFGIVYR